MIRMKRIASFDNPEQAFLFCKEKNQGQQNPKYLTFRINKKLYIVQKMLLPIEKIEVQQKPEKVYKRKKKTYILSKVPEIIELRNKGMSWNKIGDFLGLDDETCRRHYEKNNQK